MRRTSVWLVLPNLGGAKIRAISLTKQGRAGNQPREPTRPRASLGVSALVAGVSARFARKLPARTSLRAITRPSDG